MPDIDKVSFDGCGNRHGRRHKMRSASCSLSPFKITITGRCATFPSLEHISVHGQTHAAAWLAPFEAGCREHTIETLFFSLLFDQTGTGHHHRAHRLCDMLAFREAGSKSQIFNARVRAGANEDPVDMDVG